jgi:hypothetical protein
MGASLNGSPAGQGCGLVPGNQLSGMPARTPAELGPIDTPVRTQPKIDDETKDSDKKSMSALNTSRYPLCV